jgi:hypothetical protein
MEDLECAKLYLHAPFTPFDHLQPRKHRLYGVLKQKYDVYENSIATLPPIFSACVCVRVCVCVCVCARVCGEVLNLLS